MHTIKRNKLFLLSLFAGTLATGLMAQGAAAMPTELGHDIPSLEGNVDDTADGFRIVRGELGLVYDPESAEASKLSPDVDPARGGFRFVGGELGWVYERNHAR